MAAPAPAPPAPRAELPQKTTPTVASPEESPFEASLRDAHGRLMAAHGAAVGTLEAELQRMRCENTMLRMRLAELGALSQGDQEGRKAGVSPPSLLGTLDMTGMSSYSKASQPHVRTISAKGTSPHAHILNGLEGSAATASQLEFVGVAVPAASVVTPVSVHGPKADASDLQSATQPFVGSCNETELRGLMGQREPNSGRSSAASHDLASGRIEVRIGGTSDEPIRCEPEHLLVDEHGGPALPNVGTAAARSPVHLRGAPQDPDPAPDPDPVVEVRTPAAEAAEAAEATADLEPELRAVLADRGLQDLEVRRQQGGRWSVAGVAFSLLRGPRGGLLASHDGGAWEPLEAFIWQHQQRHRRGAQPPAGPAAPAAAPDHAGARWPPQRAGVWPGPRAAPREEEPRRDGLPAWRSDGMPSFNDAFPAAFHASSGSSHYYSQFRVRVPSGSQYEQQPQ